MKIWTITTEGDGEGTATAVYTTETAADTFAAQWVNSAWVEWFGKAAAPCPDDWRKAFAVLSDQTGYLGVLIVQPHDISHHPAIAAAIETLDEAEAIVLQAKKEEVDLTPGDLIDVYDAIADASSLLRGTITDQPEAFGISPNLQDHADSVTDAYIKAAKDQADDDLEIDDLAYVAISDDGDGAFVAAWLWVPESDAAKHLPKLPGVN